MNLLESFFRKIVVFFKGLNLRLVRTCDDEYNR